MGIKVKIHDDDKDRKKSPTKRQKSTLVSLYLAKKAFSRSKKSSKKATQRGRGKVVHRTSTNQKVVLKASFIKHTDGKGIKKLKAHLSYLVRSGVGLEDSLENDKELKFQLKDKELSRKDLSKLIDSWSTDPYHFRFIISPDRASDLDLDRYTKSVVKRLSRDLETNLEYFSVAHYNTDNQHVHLVLRGLDDRGNPLVINKDYIKHGMRNACELEATLSLGKEPYSNRLKRILLEVYKPKLTLIDRRLVKLSRVSKDGKLKLEIPKKGSNELSRIYFEANIKRLHFLRSINLASEDKKGRWSLKRDLEKTLYKLGRKEEIRERLANKLIKAKHLRICDEQIALKDRVSGVVLDRGVDNEFNDNKYILLETDNGFNHYQVLSKYSEDKEVKIGQRVEITPDNRSIKTDQTIIRFTKNGEFNLESFSAEVSQKVEQGTWNISVSLNAYLAKYAQRLKALNDSGIISKRDNNKYLIPKDLINRVQDLELKINKKHYVKVKSLVANKIKGK